MRVVWQWLGVDLGVQINRKTMVEFWKVGFVKLFREISQELMSCCMLLCAEYINPAIEFRDEQ